MANLYERCPICNGTRFVESGWTCRSCGGVGFVETGLTVTHVERLVEAERTRLGDPFAVARAINESLPASTPSDVREGASRLVVRMANELSAVANEQARLAEVIERTRKALNAVSINDIRWWSDQLWDDSFAKRIAGAWLEAISIMSENDSNVDLNDLADSEATNG